MKPLVEIQCENYFSSSKVPEEIQCLSNATLISYGADNNNSYNYDLLIYDDNLTFDTSTYELEGVGSCLFLEIFIDNSEFKFDTLPIKRYQSNYKNYITNVVASVNHNSKANTSESVTFVNKGKVIIKNKDLFSFELIGFNFEQDTVLSSYSGSLVSFN